MERIFAPWRLEWVSREDDTPVFDGCVFCGLAETSDDHEHRILARNSNAFIVLNKAPYNPGHLLVIPNTHGGEYTALSPETVAAMASLQQVAMTALSATFDPDGYNVGMNIDEAGGASITDHVHVHLVPRWTNDTTFMPTTANTTVLVDSLDATYDRLYEAFQELSCSSTRETGAAVWLDTPALAGEPVAPDD